MNAMYIMKQTLEIGYI